MTALAINLPKALAAVIGNVIVPTAVPISPVLNATISFKSPVDSEYARAPAEWAAAVVSLYPRPRIPVSKHGGVSDPHVPGAVFRDV